MLMIPILVPLPTKADGDGDDGDVRAEEVEAWMPVAAVGAVCAEPLIASNDKDRTRIIENRIEVLSIEGMDS